MGCFLAQKKGKENGSKPKYCGEYFASPDSKSKEAKEKNGIEEKRENFFWDSYFII